MLLDQPLFSRFLLDALGPSYLLGFSLMLFDSSLCFWPLPDVVGPFLFFFFSFFFFFWGGGGRGTLCSLLLYYILGPPLTFLGLPCVHVAFLISSPLPPPPFPVRSKTTYVLGSSLMILSLRYKKIMFVVPPLSSWTGLMFLVPALNY